MYTWTQKVFIISNFEPFNNLYLILIKLIIVFSSICCSIKEGDYLNTMDFLEAIVECLQDKLEDRDSK
jgi:hypothetical protein